MKRISVFLFLFSQDLLQFSDSRSSFRNLFPALRELFRRHGDGPTTTVSAATTTPAAASMIDIATHFLQTLKKSKNLKLNIEKEANPNERVEKVTRIPISKITNLKQVTKYSNIPGYVERKSQRMLGVELRRPATRNELVEHKKDRPSFQLRKILERQRKYLSFRDFLSAFACPRKINHTSIIQSPEIQAIIRIF